ncbi:glycoside hydrolase family 3 C-terminal domain-containing protein [Blautia sp. NSJ-166]|uniref:glycoside hydrolase family 3 C-terminal domain-containing protein n=1 Tax=Blautia sp. NSJ-166 TaxID=2931882 RepID=UPI000E487C73|nr:glycoside hydrolase family 3 C-terminal domain-containing protein [Blautia sp. NSJ-166]MCJ8045436.1 glycoside hydrolase family 3 C-terminal domain-containing protein [Blautia sp. NSJ-166]RGF88630.1 glycosyl hydrolase [Ruminococcus sp. OF03-6AA]RGH52898.1 glycosyl hydrolase [Ruminococcus sp. AM36-5]RGH60291.1 glycosyl hydrolase [Ruminococcus sp. AM36-2AA]
MERDLKKIVSEMTLEEKAGMCSGLDFWHLKEVEHLGIPKVMVSDGPHGLRKQDEKGDHLGINDSIKAVCFPPAVLSACSFDRGLMEEMGKAIGREAQANDVSVVLGPAVNIKRSPLCGRNFEYYSEDPYLAGEIAAAFVKGVQSQHVGTSIKHFAANNQEYRRMSSSSEVDERTLREIYFPAFETAVKKAQPYTFMCSYNQINGTFASENKWLLTDVLRGEWGFKGYVMSDWGAVNDRVKGLEAGLELEMPASGGDNDAMIVKAVKDGALEEKILDQAVERILRIIFEYADHRKPQEFTMEKDHEEAQHIAEESMVLLKNENHILPLKTSEKAAFIGGFARNPRFQGGGSSHINCFKTTNVLDSVPCDAQVVYAEGFPADRDFYDKALADEAVKAAAEADKAVIFAGLPESFESEGYDRSHMRLPECQNRLITEILKVQPNTVIVLHNGSPVEMPWLGEIKGLLETYLGGQAGGAAAANILYGKINPSGKLAETMPLKLSDNPSYLNFGGGEKVEYREGIFVGYRYYDTKEMDVAFPFGYGLSYTTFAYSNLKLSMENPTEKDTVMVYADVTNTGKSAGKEVVQLYIRDLTGSAIRPEKELKGFEKVFLEPGETKTVTMELNKRSFAWYNTELHDWFAASGDYEILVGASSRDIRLTETLHLNSSQRLPMHVHMNTTLGDLLRNPETAEAAKKLIQKYLSGEAGSEAASEAVSEEMTMAMTDSMPLRALMGFAGVSRKELDSVIEKLNK